MDDGSNIIQLDIIRIERNLPRKCTCKKPKFTVDSVNREIVCECGFVHDAFEAMLHLAKTHERINEQHKALHEQAKHWHKQKPWSVLFKRLEQDYQKGTMFPYCPQCKQMFDFKDVKTYGHSRFYKPKEDSK